MGFEKTKTLRLDRSYNKNIRFHFAGWDVSPAIRFSVDGDEREVQLHLGFFIGIWITFCRIFPKSWYPTYTSQHYGELPTQKEISISFHHYGLWWDFWTPEDSSFNSWRKNVIRFDELVKGKHKVNWEEQEKETFIVPFYEGNYNIEVSKKLRIDKWQRWFTQKSTSYEVKCGYYNEQGEWISVPVPEEGKGENSWDCDENATYSMYFPAKTYDFRREIKTCYDAMLYFWYSKMKSRKKYGSSKWIPKKFKKEDLKIIS